MLPWQYVFTPTFIRCSFHRVRSQQREVAMRFREELVLNIKAPREAVWAAFQDFSSWPGWAKAIK